MGEVVIKSRILRVVSQFICQALARFDFTSEIRYVCMSCFLTRIRSLHCHSEDLAALSFSMDMDVI